ncbi:MAG TPA: hypothetical protein VH724_08660 [Candidatus Angelobacter sp.]|nr:hypothetical protein [Candidatus Angelobacter sp.]
MIIAAGSAGTILADTAGEAGSTLTGTELFDVEIELELVIGAGPAEGGVAVEFAIDAGVKDTGAADAGAKDATRAGAGQSGVFCAATGKAKNASKTAQAMANLIVPSPARERKTLKIKRPDQAV